MSVISDPPAPATLGRASPNAGSLDPSGERRAAPRAEARPGGFLFSPAIDLLFIANLFWPLLLMVDVIGGVTTHESLLFWQVYFITAPHRWITLVLVAFDHEKTGYRRGTFASLAIAILLICLCLRFGTGSLLCLGVVDYVWNAWHFASQHHGIFRIYARRSESRASGQAPQPGHRNAPSGEASPGRSRLLRSRDHSWVEKAVFRGFLLYTIARVAGWGWPEGPFTGSEAVAWLDWPMLIIPVGFVVRQGIRWLRGAASLASLAYLGSMMGLFVSMLVAAHLQKGQLVIQLALASAVFHSIEYLSIVTWSMQQKRGGQKSRAKTLAYLSRMWLLFLACFVVVIGAGNYLLSRGFFDLWVLMNLVVAFWHYCFDGMIWKRPKKASAPSVAAQGAT